MKTIMLVLVMMGIAGTALAIEPADLDHRIRELTAKFEMLQARPDRAVPPDVLRRARGIILMDRTKAGFIFAYQGGGGVVMARDRQTGRWSAPAFVDGSEASLGAQIGGEQGFYAIVFMDNEATRHFAEGNFNFGGEARGTAGESSAGAGGSVALHGGDVLVFSTRNGLYGGAAIKGGSISPDEKADRVYYGQYLTTEDILFGHRAQPTESSTDLAARIDGYAQVQSEPSAPPNANPPNVIPNPNGPNAAPNPDESKVAPKSNETNVVAPNPPESNVVTPK